jgi:hypothetical protein
MNNRICPKCGTNNPAGMSFCTNCGQTLTAPAENAPQRPEEPPPTVFMNQPPPVTPRQPVAAPPQISSTPPPQPPKKNSKAWMFGVAGCLGLLIVSVVGLVIVGIALSYSDFFSKKDEPYRDFPTPSPTQKTNSNSVFNTRLSNSDSTNTTETDTTNTIPTDDDTDSGAFLVTILESRKQVGPFNQTSVTSVEAKKYFPLANGAAEAAYSNGSKNVYLMVGKFSSLPVAKENFEDRIEQVKSGSGGKVTYENTASDGTISAIYNHKGYYFTEYCNTSAFCNRIYSDNQAALKSFFESYAK